VSSGLPKKRAHRPEAGGRQGLVGAAPIRGQPGDLISQAGPRSASSLFSPSPRRDRMTRDQAAGREAGDQGQRSAPLAGRQLGGPTARDRWRTPTRPGSPAAPPARSTSACHDIAGVGTDAAHHRNQRPDTPGLTRERTTQASGDPYQAVWVGRHLSALGNTPSIGSDRRGVPADKEADGRPPATHPSPRGMRRRECPTNGVSGVHL
jgi:hypothetical protein